MKAHEFHYWDSTQNGTDCLAVKPDKKEVGIVFICEIIYLQDFHIFIFGLIKLCRAFL